MCVRVCGMMSLRVEHIYTLFETDDEMKSKDYEMEHISPHRYLEKYMSVQSNVIHGRALQRALSRKEKAA